MCGTCGGTKIEWATDEEGYGDIIEPKPCTECQ